MIEASPNAVQAICAPTFQTIVSMQSDIDPSGELSSF